MLIDKLKNRESGIILYGITPPKKGTEEELLAGIADRQIARLKPLNIDGLIVYDIQDEGSRIADERPFPFIETLNGYDYCEDYLGELDVQKVVYRSVGKYNEEQLTSFLNADANKYLSVFVGVPSQQEQVSLTMSDAYRVKQNSDSAMLLGGVTIPERHRKKGDEQERLQFKHDQGCSFFVSQGVYDLDAAKSMLSDYYYHCKEKGLETDPIIFTFTPCGSAKTLEFMKWLGISIPRWLENELIHSEDILETSVDICEQHWKELKAFADAKNIPIGANIESVAIRKVEIEASVELVRRIQATL